MLKEVSLVPSGFILTILFTVEPEYEVKFPPTKSLPSGWTLTTSVSAINPVPGLNEVSFVPSVFILTIYGDVEPE